MATLTERKRRASRFLGRYRLRGALFLLLGLVGCSDSSIKEGGAMVSAAHPLAAQAGVEMIQQGGNALDAAFAAQLVLSLVEPQSSGLGGGSFMLLFEPRTQKITHWDGRETAPAGVRADVFLDKQGKPLNFFEAVVGGQSVGVPSLVAMMAAAHKKSGSLAWSQLFQPAITLARAGFPISPRLAAWIARDPFLKKTRAAKMFFDEAGQPRRAGEIIKNPAFAQTLTLIAQGGADVFYQGALADDIVRAVGGKNNFSKKDMARYRPKIREAVCGSYRGYKICAAAPPSSGGITLLQILGILEHFSLSPLKPTSAHAIHLIAEASRLAYADRARYLADPDFVAVPIAQLLNKNYLKKRAAQINPAHRQENPQAGRLTLSAPPRRRPPPQEERSLPSTTHLSVVDRQGRGVAMTSSIEGPFGSHIFVRGFFLNNELTDFSFVPQVRGKKVANRVQAGKRPLSSMTPTLIFSPNGALFATLGSPGGRRIIAYVAQTIIALIDWQLPMAAAIALPRHTALGVAHRTSDRVEIEPALAAIKKALEEKGHEVVVRPLTSGLHGIRITNGTMDGGADPRRDGAALGVR